LATRVSRARAAELHTASQMFLRDAEAFSGASAPGRLVLTAIAIELALKSFLHERGYPFEDLSRPPFGQDINRLLGEARHAGLVPSQRFTDNIVWRLNAAAEKARLRCDYAFENLPPPPDVLAVARGLWADTEPTPQP
jgi:hypothetical protein